MTREKRNLLHGLVFLAPNVLGFLTFTAVPLVFSLVLAFSNWDLKLHNRFKEDGQLQYVGAENFGALLRSGDFWQYLGNTLFLMIGLPFAIAASLFSAIMLSKDLRGGSRRSWAILIACAVGISSVLLLVALGMNATATTILMCAMIGFTLLLGAIGGSTAYRTLFYLPYFTNGVATLLLWKKMYSPQNGPINNALAPVLDVTTHIVTATPETIIRATAWLFVLLACALAIYAFRALLRRWIDGELGSASALVAGAIVIGTSITCGWLAPTRAMTWTVLSITSIAGVFAFVRTISRGRDFTARPDDAMGGSLMLSSTLGIVQLIAIALAIVVFTLPESARAPGGLQPPNWLGDYHWAKPALMIMGFWGAVGSNTMLLYLAALTNVPAELYEAADIDGASRFQRFWNITWPQLAPTTFFIVIMGVIGGLQAGFDAARVMTGGGPAGSTTTLAYMIYNEGFVTGRLGYASAASWLLFAMVLTITLFNWKFGNRYVND